MPEAPTLVERTPEGPAGANDINDNVDALASLRARAEQEVSAHQRRVERFTAMVGRPQALVLVVSLVAAWVAINLGMLGLGLAPFDPPPFDGLQLLTGLGALLMTITILTTQNRQTRHGEQRAQLELQVSLLAEQKIAKLIALLEELRHDLPSVHDRVDREAEIMQQPVDPHAVLSALEHTLEAQPAEGPEAQAELELERRR